MPPEPVPADPGPDEDLAWLDRDPMTVEEREAALDRICEEDEPPELEDDGDYKPFTAKELAEIREAAADELLAVNIELLAAQKQISHVEANFLHDLIT